MAESTDNQNSAEANNGPTHYSSFERVIGTMAGVALLAMMVLVFADVIGRYVLGSPIAGAYQLGSILMVVLLFSSLPIVTIREAHLTVGFTEGQFKGRAKDIQRFGINALSTFVMGVVCWRLWSQGQYFTTYAEILEVLDIPLFLLCYFMSIMTGLSAALHLANAGRYLHRLLAKERPD